MRQTLRQVFTIIILSLVVSSLLLYLPLLVNLKQIASLGQKYSTNIFEPDNFSLEQSKKLTKNLQQLEKNWQRLNAISHMLPIPKNSKLIIEHSQTFIKEINIFTNWLLEDQEKNLIILLQNSHELRASGGFMGSYAQVKLKRGLIYELYFNDIYEPDGRYDDSLVDKNDPPPPTPLPVAKYLSQGKNWRLPDSNWHPDFYLSAQNILWFFQKSAKDDQLEHINGLVAINLSLAEDVLKLTGPVYLNDFETEVNQENLATVARMEREDFFPGTKQKRHFFSLLFNQLKFKFKQFKKEDYLGLIELIYKNLINKNIQVYLEDANNQKLLQKYHFTGTIGPNKESEHQAYLYLLESNVGINKANAKVDRIVNLHPENQKINVKMTFTNNNQQPEKQMVHNRFIQEANHLSYINYQRIIVNANAQISDIKIDGKEVKHIDQKIIVNHQLKEFKQYGFLISIAEQDTKQLEFTISYDQDFDHIFIQKQPGLAAVNYIVAYNRQEETFFLDKDTYLNLEN